MKKLLAISVSFLFFGLGCGLGPSQEARVINSAVRWGALGAGIGALGSVAGKSPNTGQAAAIGALAGATLGAINEIKRPMPPTPQPIPANISGNVYKPEIVVNFSGRFDPEARFLITKEIRSLGYQVKDSRGYFLFTQPSFSMNFSLINRNLSVVCITTLKEGGGRIIAQGKGEAPVFILTTSTDIARSQTEACIEATRNLW